MAQNISNKYIKFGLALFIVACFFLLFMCNASSNKAKKVEAVSSIGEATMTSDGTLILNLRATDSEGKIIGDAQVTYPPNDPDYQKILDHVGPIRPGETKPCPPWDESK